VCALTDDELLSSKQEFFVFTKFGLKMEITVTFKVELEDVSSISSPALAWIKHQLTKEFVQLLNDTAPGEITVDGVKTVHSGKKILDPDANTEKLIKYKVVPLFKQRSIIDYIR